MSLLAALDPIPNSEPIAERNGQLTATWYRWFSQLIGRSGLSVVAVGNSVHRVGVSAPTIATTLFIPSQPGLYRVNWYAQVTTPSGGTSSLAVTFSWRANGVTQSKTFAPASLTTNTLGSSDGDSFTIRPDAGQAVTYSTAWSSTGAPPMVYQLDVSAEQLP